MLEIWVSDVGAPDEVFPNSYFDVYCRVGYLINPFKNITFFAYIINSNGELIEYKKEKKFVLWFWGFIDFTFKVQSKMDDDIYTICVGYEE